MSKSRKISRRQFIRLAGAAASGAVLAACSPATTPTSGPTSAPATAVPATAAPTAAPTVAKARKVVLAVGGWAEQSTKDLLEKTGFTQKTGIEVEVFVRSDNKETELTRVTGAVQAGTAPYDVVDFEDELTTSFGPAGYMLPVDDLLPADFWDDFSPAMIEYSKVWSTHEGAMIRIIHNWEMPYWWYRKDWFDEKGVSLPTTWDEVGALGATFTDEANGVWATEEGMIKGGFMNVYLAWLTLQAGGNLYEAGDEFRTALQYAYDLMHTHKALNPASLEKDYPTLNGDYTADKVAFMRQWPYFYDVARGDPNTAWFAEDKVAVGLPPVGPGGVGGGTYTAAWGWGILKTSPNLEEAKELYRHLIDKDVAVEGAKTAAWFLSARKSVLGAMGGEGVAGLMKMYTDAGVIGVRPHHPQFVEASTICEDAASSYFTDQLSLDEAVEQAKNQLATLG